ncbi:protein of unknown function [Blastococcus saxobsidens DD2]|uniref:Uncharacterized protein n=1 Tax=Blastococcus saxobsidens (strain DD2) TaxID=1146883 RepID=H6RPS7_BLASD|nr:protein of unknown function [Blastococcus saxobsidens DD2]
MGSTVRTLPAGARTRIGHPVPHVTHRHQLVTVRVRCAERGATMEPRGASRLPGRRGSP